MRGALRRSNYRSWIEEAIRRYVRAFDFVDWEVAFVQAWSLLEYLTDSRHHDRVVDRAAYACNEPQYHKQVLRHLREHRNESVHSGRVSDEREFHIFQAKTYAEVLLRFHLVHSHQFANHSETATVLDSTRSLRKIEVQCKALNIAWQVAGGKGRLVVQK